MDSLPKEKTLSVMEHIAEGVGVRKTGRFTKVNRATVSRLTKLAGEHAVLKLGEKTIDAAASGDFRACLH